jgi:benzoyl-CoA reductase/2-hydroxyglutaryl-CoA dehydratase subunit BcrC/BadD/HgdB
MSKFKPIPGFDSLKWKQEVQAKIYEETKDMTPEQRRERLRKIVEEGDKRRAERERRIAAGDPTVPTFTMG